MKQPRAALAMPVVAMAMVASSCVGTTSSPTPEATDAAQSVIVAPNLDAPTVTVNLTLSDSGFEPSTLSLPAGRNIRLVVRNRGTTEHHFRVKGLLTAGLTWLHPPELDEYDLDSMSLEELAEYGIVGDIDDPEHVLHHLTPQFLPFKEKSPAGITPLFNEVHAYAIPGTFDVLSFFATTTGTFEAEDLLYPEITGRVIVFEEQP